MLIATWLADQAKQALFKDQFQEMILSQPFELSEPDRLSDFLPRIFVSYILVFITAMIMPNWK